MHIKSLEICGFKSFVDRTTIHFDHDVIGVVGPNGCGKSNIVDAIRWCMGEQSAKHLRGRSMEDVIFNGSESRGPHGFAEVTITFDNTNLEHAAELPAEYRHYPEIAVTRRLFRDGTSEYLLNKTQVRLRDVTELFLGTGVGTKAYSIVEQGRIGQIVSARPEDRRVFIEEAAGITKYKQRRKQAERKIELTKQNLLRITDIVSEIERSRNSLKRQVAKAERYLNYRHELEDLSLHEASHKYLEFVVTSRVQAEIYEENSGRAEALRVQLEALDNGLDDQRQAALDLESEADETARAAFEADNEVTTYQADAARCRDRLSHLQDKNAAIELEQKDVAERVSLLLVEQEEFERRVTDLGRDQQAREQDAAAEIESLDVLRLEEQRAGESVQGLRARVGQASNQAAAAAARLDALEQRHTDLRSRRDRLEAELVKMTTELSELAGRRGALEQSVAELLEGKRLSVEERAALETAVTDLRARLFESERALDAAKNELGVKRNRLRALEDLHRKHEGVGVGVRALLSYADESVRGLVADRLEAPQAMQQALAGLLGERLQYVVVTEMARGIALLERLRREKRGRAHVIASHPPYVAGGRRMLPIGAGADGTEVIGFLVDALRFAPEDEALARALVGDAIVVSSAAAALRLAARYSDCTFVSTDGTVVRPGGIIGGGTGDEIAAHLVEQKRELRVLGEEVTKLEANHAQVAAEHASLRARVAETVTALDHARQQAHQGELAHVTAEKDLSSTLDQIARATVRCDTVRNDLGEHERELEQCLADAETGTLGLDELHAEVARLNEELARANDSAAEWRERVAAQSATVTERKIRLAQVREQIDAARSALERSERSLADLAGRSQRLLEDARETAVAFGETAARAMLAQEGRIVAAARARESHVRLEDMRERLDVLRKELAEREHGLRGVREELENIDGLVRGAEMTLTRLRIEHDHLLQSIREKFRGLDLEKVVGDYHLRPLPDPEQHRRIEELSQLIDRMGPVNLDAKAEFDEAERRFVELNSQKVDLDKALDDLERAIKLMNKDSRKRFRESFDAINELFKKSFYRNFRGGRAELVLTDPEDLLGTGVDIVAQPPGKKLANIELMSGGEKALTATSLIFAIFQHKPSPFCILDEVDAPLDEANVARYNEAIRSMTDRSQFILITHVRKTMQMVDTLYGITMGEPGVSRVVSVKVNDNAVTRSDSLAAANALRTAQSTAPEAASEEAAGEVRVA
jgi:chromosome segregation protein